MKKTKLTDRHFCYVLFVDMRPSDFIELLKTNVINDNLTFLDSRYHKELYEEAKEKMLNLNFGGVSFEFDYDLEPFVFKKFIDGNFDREYKICIFEISEKTEAIKLSDVYCNGKPLFFDGEGNMIKNSDN